MPHDNHAPTGSGRFFCFLKIPPDNKKSKCGGGLARESTGSVSTCFPGTPLSRASPPPQGKASNLKIFVQNIDPERYSPESNRLKDPRRQLSALQASNNNFPRHTRNIRLNPTQTIVIIIWHVKTSLQLKQNLIVQKPANAHTTRATAPRRCTMCLFHRIISPWEFYLPGV